MARAEPEVRRFSLRQLSVGLSLTAIGMAVLVGLAVTAEGAPNDSLTFLSTDSLSVKFRTSADPYVTDVLIANAGEARNDVAFSLIFMKAGKVTSSLITVSSTERMIGANATRAFPLTFVPNGTTDSFTGYVIASAGGASPGSRRVSTHLDQRVLFALGPVTPTLGSLGFPGGPGSVLSWAVLIAAVLVVLRALCGRYDLRKKMGGQKYKFTESFASTATGLGAIFGTALGAGVLPDEPELLAKEQFLGLNILFAMLLLAGAAIYQIFQDGNGQARVLVFLVAVLFTFTAVFGELLTFVLLVGEASTKFDSRVLTWSFVLLALFAAGLLVVYGVRGIQTAYKKGTGLRAFELALAPADTPEDWVAL